MNLMFTIALLAALVGAVAGFAGVFVVLRRVAMLGDAISHALLPGLVVGFVVAQGPALWAGAAGAVLAGLVTVALVEWLEKRARIRVDAALGLVFPVMFALGVALISRGFQNVHLDADAVLYGDIVFALDDRLIVGGKDLGPVAIWTLSLVAILQVAFVLIFRKELSLTTFAPESPDLDPQRVAWLRWGFLGLTCLTLVITFSAVGAVLAVGVLVIPAAIASLWTSRLGAMLVLSPLIGGLAGFGGLAIAWAPDWSPSGTIVAVLGVAVFGSVLFGPRAAGLRAIRQRKRQRESVHALTLLVHLQTHQGTAGEDQESIFGHLLTELGWDSRQAQGAVCSAVDRGWMERRGDHLLLTENGRRLASQMTP
ncbi:MAG: metal ABC transporter permease [Fimbriimonadaceae bacterium]|nr:metal ABC transporter permease [Fimbriimonadaceae bacterium]